jgi:hypothetical protein
MFVRFLCNWAPYADGQCLEIPDRVGADFVARAMAEVVTGADVQIYTATMAAIDRAIDDKRINAMPVGASRMPARGGRRTITEDQWRRELGQKGPASFRHVPATLTVRS